MTASWKGRFSPISAPLRACGVARNRGSQKALVPSSRPSSAGTSYWPQRLQLDVRCPPDLRGGVRWGETQFIPRGLSEQMVVGMFLSEKCWEVGSHVWGVGGCGSF